MTDYELAKALFPKAADIVAEATAGTPKTSQVRGYATSDSSDGSVTVVLDTDAAGDNAEIEVPTQGGITEGSEVLVTLLDGVPVDVTQASSIDATAEVAQAAWDYADEAKAAADSAQDSADAAARAASSAQSSANSAAASAAQAIRDAASAQSSADSAASAAGAAQTSANAAQASANTANAHATAALNSLATVEDVVDTLTWITEHGTMTKTTDTAVDASKVYFVRDANGDYTVGSYTYSIVQSPVASGLSSYYELTIDKSVENYIATHLSVTNEGLWLTPTASNGYKVLVATGAGSTYTTAGTYIIDGSGVTIAQFTGTGISFADDKSFTIGDDSAYIYFDGAGHINIGGSGITISALSDYSTTSEMESAIETSAEGITSTVASTYLTQTDAASTYATDSDLTDLESRMTSAESSITQNATNISSKVSQTDYTGATIASLINQSASTVTIEAEHIELDGAVTIGDLSSDAQAAVLNSNLQVGGRNLLRNTGDFAGWLVSGNYPGSATNGIWTFPAHSSLDWSGMSSPFPRLALSDYDGETLTLSFDYRSDNFSDTSGNHYVYINVHGHTSADSAPRTKYRQISTSTFNGVFVPATEWQRGSITFTMSESLLTSGSGAVTHFSIMFYNHTLNSYQLRHVKLEKGNVATDWTPAPEDTAATATNYITEISNDGIFVHTTDSSSPTAATAQGVHISDSVDIVRNGVSVAEYGETARVGAESSGHMVTDSDGITAYRSTTPFMTLTNDGTYTTLAGMGERYDNGTSEQVHSTGKLEMEGGDLVTTSALRNMLYLQLESTDGTNILMETDIHFIHSVDENGDPDTDSKYNNGVFVNSPYGTYVLDPYDTSELPDFFQLGKPTHLVASDSVRITTAGIDTPTAGPSLTLSAGVWLVTGVVIFNSGSSSGTRNLEAHFRIGSSVYNESQRIMAAAQNFAKLNIVTFITLSADTTVTLEGASSMTYTTATTWFINAARVV